MSESSTEQKPHGPWAAAVRTARGQLSIESFSRTLRVSWRTVWAWEHGRVPSALAQDRLRETYPAIAFPPRGAA